MRIQYIGLIVLLFLLMFHAGCKKFVDIAAPVDKQNRVDVFLDSATAHSAMAGIYSEMANGSLTLARHIALLGGLSADEITAASTNADVVFLENNILTDNSNLENVWRLAYRHIYQANAIIDGVQASATLKPAVKQQLIAEAKFIRAFCHFYLVNLFGKVPLITSTDYTVNQSVGNIAIDKVYLQMVNDLTDAVALLKESYIMTDRVRPNKWTAAALLARVYLYQSNWQKAEEMATDIINTGLYTPLPTPANTFLKTSKETIWQLFPANPGFNTPYGNVFVPGNTTTVPAYPIQNVLVNAFEADDQRKTTWAKTQKINDITYYFPYKYKLRTGTSSIAATEYPVMFRLAEQYLLRAEARVKQNKLPEALADIDMVRARAGLPGLPVSLSQSQVLDAVEQERRVELFTESAHRWLDLKRTDRANAVIGSLKTTNWQPEDVLWPIPETQIRANPFLQQNIGY